MVPGDTNGVMDVFVHDRQNNTTQRVSVSSNGTQGNGQSYAAFIGGNGQFISFYSRATNLGFPSEPNYYVRDLTNDETELVNVGIDSSAIAALWIYQKAPLSLEGRYIAFTTGEALYVRDRNSDEAGQEVGILPDDLTAQPIYEPSMSADGCFVAFTAAVESPSLSGWRVFLRDLETDTTAHVGIGVDENPVEAGLPSLSADGTVAAFVSAGMVFVRDLSPTGATTLVAQGTSPSVSGDGRFIAYESQAGISVYDRLSGETQVVAAGAAPAISADGRFLAFSSAASDLVPGDDNEAVDIFVVSLESFFDF